ncbi:proton-coupled amino acid transporter-like protein CG1139 [Hylaeus anthracinus]|uniref:proton-coupled amino acid transporter-like protein CG1139 n=1 Tax=Hylaeus anthracinus TaxID=313031 RepID=UPI0023B9DA38|nr:proton-coupled amino acid transporter-like protein CG1139 [Hylaeus anthracinus]
MTRAGRGGSQEQSNDDYDPYAHRETLKPVSDFGSLATLVKSAVGTGLFAIPNAFSDVGLFIGIVGTILMGMFITGSLQILLKIHQTMCIKLKKPILNYDEVVVASLTIGVRKPWLSARVATFMVDVIMLTCYMGVGAVYVVFVSGVIQECIDTGKTIDQGYYALMFFPIFFLMNMMKHLKDMASAAIVGNVLLFSAALIGTVYALKDGIGEKWVWVSPRIGLYPKFIGTVFFSMVSPGVILAIEHEMETPWNYTKLCGVLHWGMTFITLLHVLVGAIGYLKWGTDALGNFIRNHRVNDVATVAALSMQAIAIYFTYGLQCYMPINILSNAYVLPALEENICKGSPFVWDLIVRFAVSLATCLLAASIPKLDLFTGLVGSICISTLSTLIPVALYILVYYGNYGSRKWRLILGLSLLFIGLVITLCAVVVNLTLIVQYFAQK